MHKLCNSTYIVLEQLRIGNTHFPKPDSFCMVFIFLESQAPFIDEVINLVKIVFRYLYKFSCPIYKKETRIAIALNVAPNFNFKVLALCHVTQSKGNLTLPLECLEFVLYLEHTYRNKILFTRHWVNFHPAKIIYIRKTIPHMSGY